MAVSAARAAGYNRRLGNRLGRPMTNRAPVNAISASPRQRMNAIAYGAPSVRPATTRAYRQGTGRGAGGAINTGYNPATVQGIWQRAYDELTTQYQETAATQRAIDAANQATEPDIDRPWYQDIGQAVFGAGEEKPGTGGFANSLFGRALDLTQRIPYGVFEGMQTLAEDTHDEDEMSTLHQGRHIASDFFGGFGRGFTGENKTGFGDVYEAVKENPTTSVGEGLRAFEEAHPNWEQALAITTGALGEIFLDPSGVVTPALPRFIKGTDELATAGAVSRMHVNQAAHAGTEFAANASIAANHAIYSRYPTMLGDRAAAATQDALDASMLQVTGGGSRGTRLLNNRRWPTVVAGKQTEAIRRGLLNPLLDHAKTLWDRGIRGAIDISTVNATRKYVDDYDEFYRLLEAEFAPLGIDPLDALKNGRLSRKRFEQLLDEVAQKYDPELDILYDELFRTARNATYRAPGVRIAGQPVAFKAVGRAYSRIGARVAGSKIGQRVFPTLQNIWENKVFESMFPGRLGVLTTRARSIGQRVLDPSTGALEKWDTVLKEIEQQARKFGKEEAKELTRLLDNGIKTGNAKMDDAVDWIRAQYDAIIAREQAGGGRSTRKIDKGYRKGDNYTFIYNRGGSVDARTAFKNGRKDKIHKTGSPGGYDIAKAKADGLRPVENAFDNLRMRWMKSNRDMTRAAFWQDLITNYALEGPAPSRRLTPNAAEKRGLGNAARPGMPVPYSKLQASFRTQVDATGGTHAFYLPREMHNVAEQFEKILGWNPTNSNAFARHFSRVINIYKSWQTIPFPGFHNRNIIGDIFMGLMDGVGIKTFSEVAKKYALNKAGKIQHFGIAPGLSHSYDEMFNMYEEAADAGFAVTDLNKMHTMTAGDIPRRVSGAVVNTARKVSDTRELVPRFTHFVHAYREEARALFAKGVKDPATLQRRATDVAIWRVNHYKFDYNALMPFEQKMKSLAFPFYTYLRKAIPTLVEQMLVNPQWLGKVSRFMEYNDGSSADDFNESNIPQWIRDMGFAMLTDEDEPMALTADIFPLGALDLLSSWQGPSPSENIFDEDFLRGILAQTNPAVQIPIERAFGRTLYEDQPIPEDLLTYFGSKVPVVGDVNELLNQTSGKPWWQQLVSERLGLGIPLRTISREQQAQQLQTNRDIAIEEPIDDFNHSQDRYRISISTNPTTGNLQYNLNDQWMDPAGETTLMVFQTPSAAITYAMSLPNINYQTPFVDPFEPPTNQDVLSRVPQLTQ